MTRLLLDDRLAPITFDIGFVEIDVARRTALRHFAEDVRRDVVLEEPEAVRQDGLYAAVDLELG